MTAEDNSAWRQRADALFAEALELPTAERPAFLERGCDGDDRLRRKVERLLAADLEAGDFLEPTPAGSGALHTEEGLPDGGRIGSYRLRRRLGSGGTATVYLAERDGDHQQVAVKLLAGGTGAGELRTRFDRERRFLARLEHPNVARLYDGGVTAAGRSYLVMEYVEGLPVDEYCDRNRLTIEARLRLFRKICAAVEFAHQNLLVHRDLKPDNVLVTSEGEPKLLDFGIAKLVASEVPGEFPDEVRLTLTGFGPMTPRYASPEQVRGEAVSTASDVYALGVMLYELLAGCSPYGPQRMTFHKIGWAVCEQEPPLMSVAIARPHDTEVGTGAVPPTDLGGDRSMDAMAVAQARLVSPGELRRSLKGDLDHIADRALRKQPQQRYASVGRLSEDIHRHLQNLPVLTRSGSFAYRGGKFIRRHRTELIVLAAVGVLVLGFVGVLAWQARELAQERDRAERALAFLVDVLKAPEPGRARGETITARQILDQGAERILDETEGLPEVRATLMDAIGQVYLDLGLLDRAKPLLEGALELRREHFGDDRPVLADSLQHLALLRHEMGDYPAAEILFREGLAMRRRFPNDPLAVAESLDGLSTTLRWSGQLAGAEPVHLEALEIRRRELGRNHPLVAQSLDSLASLSLRLGDYARAAELYGEAEEIQRVSLGEDHPDRVMTLKNLGLTLAHQGESARSEALVREAVVMLRKTLGDEHPWYGQGLINLAAIVSDRGDHHEAKRLSLEAVALQKGHLGLEHPDVAFGLNRLGRARLALDELDAAEGDFREALTITLAAVGADHSRVGHLNEALATVALRRGDLETAARLYNKSLLSLTRNLHDHHRDLATPLVGLARVAQESAEPAAAESYLRRALTILRASLPVTHWRIAEVESELGAHLAVTGRDAEATTLLESSAASLAARFGADDSRAELARRRLESL